MDRSNDTLIGKRIDEYLIDMPLGAGGMARVYKALDTRLQRLVALKVIAPNLRADNAYTVRFEREAQSIARLDHPNIVHVYRFGEAEGLYYIAMQYIEGVDVGVLLEQYRLDGTVMPIQDVAHIISDIASALDYAHSKDVIHRDVKPSNIIVNEDGQAILTDFGLVMTSDFGSKGESFGSPSYIAPEQAISSAHAVPQSDIYALGVTLFQMLTGELPFTDTDPMKIAMRHVSEPPPAPSQFNRTIPNAVDEVVLRSMSKDPAQRYQTAQEFSTALRHAVDTWSMEDNHPQTTRPGSIPEFTAPVLLSEVPPAVTMPTRAPQSPPKVMQPPPAHDSASVVSSSQSIGWMVPLVIAGIMFGVAVLALVIVFFATHPNNAQSILAVPTLTPSHNSIAPTLQPSNTAQTVPTARPANLLPPQDRNTVPPGSYRLGEFAVESFCNDRGYGIILVNNKSDWACTQTSNYAVVHTLVPSDFDALCRARYQSQTAFAIRDQQKDIPAYDWSCYDYSPTANSAAVPATPSVKTLLPHYAQDWMALVNVSNMPLSLQGIEFRAEGHTLSTQAWGQSVLAPGACLRLYRTDQPPADQPPKCTTVFDYSPGAPDRDRWFTQKVTIVINPTTSYCYPAEKCNQP